MRRFSSMMHLLKWFLRSAVILVLIILSIRSLFVEFQWVQSKSSLMADQLDPASDWENRLRAVRDALPPYGSVGYISEENIPGLKYDPIDSDQEFGLTQYFLVPRILARGSILKYTIGNLNLADANQIDLKALLGVQKVTSYGMGIYLFERTQP